MVEAETPQYIFVSKNTDRLLLALPMVTAIYILYSAFYLHQNLDFYFKNFAITGILLFGSAHSYLTVVGLLCLPSYQVWKQQMKTQERFFIAKPLIIAIVMSLVVYESSFILAEQRPFIFNLFLLFIVNLLPAKHVVSQTRGIAFLYDRLYARNRSLDSNQKHILQTSQKQEKIITNIFIWSYFSYFIIKHSGNLENAKTFNIIWIVWMIALLLALAYVSFKSEAPSRKYKFFVYGGLINFILAPFFMVGVLAFRSLHGLEYAALFWRQCKESHLKSSMIFKVLTLVGASVLFVTIYWLLSESARNPSALNSSIPILLGVNSFFSNYHLFIDKQLFSFGNEASAKHILPLIIK